MALELNPQSSRSGPSLGWASFAQAQRAGPLDTCAHLIDTTILFAPRSGGVKRYLLAKRAWFAAHRPGVRHTLMVPGPATRFSDRGLVTVSAPRLPFGDGYRWPTSYRKWADHLSALRPSLIEAGDPYAAGAAALEAGARCGAPVVGFCHTDPAALAALHLGSWAEAPVRRRWASIFRRFDQVLAPSRHIAERLDQAGVPAVMVESLGVDIDLFHPGRGDRSAVRRALGLTDGVRLLVFAGRPAREKNVEIMMDSVARLGAGHHLLLIGAGSGLKAQSNVSILGFQKDARALAMWLASCDAFLHANPFEPFGLAVLEAMACGLPIVGVASGGVSEIVDQDVGQLAKNATAAALAEAIEALFARDLQSLSAAARFRAASRHSWCSTFERLCARYAHLSGDARFAGVAAAKSWRML